MNDITNCPICNSADNHVFLKSKNFRINLKPFDIKECNACSFRFTSPLPKEDEIGEYYATENYISHSGTKKGVINSIYHLVRYFTIRGKHRLAKKLTNGNNLLDIGTGSGSFISFLKEKGWDVKGVEPDQSSRENIKKEHGIDVFPSLDLTQLGSGQFDVVTMWHVLEHVYELKEYISTIKQLLKKDGTFIVAVPNCSSSDAEHYKEFWAAYDLPIHLYHFRPDDIKNLVNQFDMEVVGMKPMKFDSYYVSLESEKYKNEKASLTSYFKGFYYGLISNLKAKNGQYSSQIYIIKNK